MPNITPEQLAELERLEQAATKGPWERRDTIIGRDNYHASTEIVGHVQRTTTGSVLGSTPVCKLSSGFATFEADCELVPAARNHLPALLATIRAQQTELERLRKAAEAAHEYIVTLRQMSYAGDSAVHKAAWERSDSVGSRYYAARSAAELEST